MTFSRCLHCGDTFSSYKRDQHTCRDREETTDD